MNYLQATLLSFSLATLMVGCGTESDEAPLVPEIVSIEIDGTDVNSSLHSIIIDTDETQLSATVTYDDGSSSSATFQLDWESNDTDVITVNNGLLTPVANSGSVAISASFRDKLYTTIDKNITLIPLTDINITSEDINITELNSTFYRLDTNTTGSYSLNVYGTFADSNVTAAPISSNIQWVSSNTTIASVSTEGLLTINAFDQNSTADINVSIFNDVNATLELNITTP